MSDDDDDTTTIEINIESSVATGRLEIGKATDVGRVREANEDSLLVVQPAGPRTNQALVAVADGMGGHKAGEVASQLAIETLERALDLIDPRAPATAFLTEAIQTGNRTIWEA